MISFSYIMMTPGAARSTPIELLESELLSRIQTLLSFVLVSYVSLSIQRWEDYRSKLGRLWAGLENTVYFACQFMNKNDVKVGRLRATVIRLARLAFNLLFFAMQDNDDFTKLTSSEAEGGLGLMTPQEEALLLAGRANHRPLIVVAWIFGIVNELIVVTIDVNAENVGVTPSSSSSTQSILLRQNSDALFMECRGGITACVGILNAPFPLMYTHIVYWTVQMLLGCMAVSTGMYLAVCWERRHNGNEGFEFDDAFDDDDGKHYPEDVVQWYTCVWMFRVAGNMMFALLVEGLLKVCELVENPFTDDKFGLPGFVFESILNNNMMCILAGSQSYIDVLKAEDKDAFGLKGWAR
jgi:hypothetical protein